MSGSSKRESDLPFRDRNDVFTNNHSSHRQLSEHLANNASVHVSVAHCDQADTSQSYLSDDSQFNNSAPGMQYNNTSAGNQVNYSGSGNATFNFDQTRPRPKPTILIPFRRDPDFIERDVLHDVVHKSKEPGARIGLVGLGGVGKTQIAIEYAYQRRDADTSLWIFWVFAANRTRFEDSFRDIAQHLQLDGAHDPQTDILKLVYIWLSNEHNGKWTLILDNADYSGVLFAKNDSEDNPRKPLSSYLPKSPNGSILITSRDQEVVQNLGVHFRDVLSVSFMDKEQSVSLLSHKLSGIGGRASEEDMAELVHELDYVPLAIAQAAAYICKRYPEATVSKYLEMLQSSDSGRFRLLSYNGRDPQRDEESSNSILKTWHISFEHIRKLRPDAADLLSFMCVCDRQSIQRVLLLEHYKQKCRECDLATAKNKPEPKYQRVGRRQQLREGPRKLRLGSRRAQVELQNNDLEDASTCTETTTITENKDIMTTTLAEEDIAHKFENSILLLRSFRLVNISPDGISFNMHRLVHITTRNWLQLSDRLANWQDNVIIALHNSLPEWARDEKQDISFTMVQSQVLALLPHVLAVLSYTPAQRTIVKTFVSLLHCQWFYHYYYVGLQTAELLARKSVELCQATHEYGHEITLKSLARLLLTLLELRKYEDAEQVAQHVLQISENALGPEDEWTLISLRQLGDAYTGQSKFAEAETILRKALLVQERKLGEFHGDTLGSRFNLSQALVQQGKLEEAEDIHVRVLARWEANLPKEYLGVSLWHSLAEIYEHQSKFDLSYEMYAKHLAWCVSCLGDEHSDVCICLNNLACAALNRGNLEEAKDLFEQSVVGFEKCYGDSHQYTANARNKLAEVNQLLQKRDEQ